MTTFRVPSDYSWTRDEVERACARLSMPDSITEKLGAFVESDTKTLRLASLSTSDRVHVHALCDLFGWSHESSGSEEHRVLTLKKESGATLSVVVKQGCLYLVGSCIESLVAPLLRHVPDAMQERRRMRDGASGQHHITLLHRKELTRLMKGGKKQTTKQIEARFASALKNALDAQADGGDDVLHVLGVGRVTKKANTVFFGVVIFPVGDSIRTELGLEDKDFHITLGYAETDIHDVTKDRTTLIDVDRP